MTCIVTVPVSDDRAVPLAQITPSPDLTTVLPFLIWYETLISPDVPSWFAECSLYCAVIVAFFSLLESRIAVSPVISGGE